MRMDYIKIVNWDKWQSYRKDRGQPPWIKMHRCLMRNPEWISLTDAERGQLVAIWLLAADHDGVIPASPDLIKKICFMTKAPNLKKLEELGFLDANTTPTRRQRDEPKAETDKSREEKIREEGIVRGEERGHKSAVAEGVPSPPANGHRIPLNDGSEYSIEDSDYEEWSQLYPSVDIDQALRDCRGWNLAEKKRRKTRQGIKKHINYWLSKRQDQARASPAIAKTREQRVRELEALRHDSK